MSLNRSVSWRARSTVLGIAVALVALLALTLPFARPAVGSVDLTLEAPVPGFTPLCLRLTRGRLETNALTQAPTFLHRYYHLQEEVRPVSVARYRFQNGIQSIARRFGLGRLVEAVSQSAVPREEDKTVLWVGYRSTNSILFQGVVLVPGQGPPLRLTPIAGLGITAGQKHLHLDSFELPGRLTNAGQYRLVQPKGNQTLLSFRYE